MSKRVLSSVLFALVNSGFSHAAENRTAAVSASDVWQRDDRAFVYQHDGRTRYPSSVRMRDGRIVDDGAGPGSTGPSTEQTETAT